MQVDELHMAVDEVRIDRLLEDVRGILLPGPLDERKVPGTDALLHPELGHRKMSDASNLGTTANADRRAATSADLEGSNEPE
eukprot:8152571-Alexandrium_andersonii.AAC.1